MHRIKLLVALMMALFVFVPCRGQSDDEVRDSLRFCQSQVDMLNSRLDSNEVLLATLRRRMNDLVMLKDSLIAANDLFQRQLQEKNRLMDEQKAAMQEKERLVAEKEELYRQGAVYAAMSGSGSALFGFFRDTDNVQEKAFHDCFFRVL